jgi:thymidylate synthase
MKPYIDLLKDILDNGFSRGDRTGNGRRSVVGRQIRFNMNDGFPLVTTRKIYTKAIIKELLWFLSGSTDTSVLNSDNVSIWDKWVLTEEYANKIISQIKELSDELEYTDIVEKTLDDNLSKEETFLYDFIYYCCTEVWNDDLNFFDFKYVKENILEHIESLKGSIGNLYGYTWRNLCNNDQIKELISNLKTNPLSARHLVTTWIPEYIADEGKDIEQNILLGKGGIAPCHVLFQCFVIPSDDPNVKSKLSLQMYQRSVDTPIGAPYNIAQYSILLHMLAQITDMEPYEFIWTTGDTHIYLNQLEAAAIQIEREPQPLPKLWLNPEVKCIFDFKEEDIKILDYNSLEEIKYELAR